MSPRDDRPDHPGATSAPSASSEQDAAAPGAGGPPARSDDDAAPAAVTDPAELLRIASMTQALQSEVHEVSLDEPGRARLHDIHRRAVEQVKSLVSDELREELDGLELPLGGSEPSEAELRVAQAQLMGWLDGLFRGIQAAVMSQQMAQQQGQQPMVQQGRPQEPGSAGYL